MSLGKKAYGRPLVYLLGTMLLAYVLYHSLAGGTLLAHNVYDSYSLQAENWLAGRCWLQNGAQYTWLELAVYHGRYYLSFPPVPSVLMLPLTAACGGAAGVPSNAVALLVGLTSAAGVYTLAARWGAAPERCVFWAALVCMGSNFWWMSTSGGVWFLAQTLNLCLVVWGLVLARGAGTAAHTGAALLLALAVGCRPFSILLLAGWLALLLARGVRGADVPAAGKKGGFAADATAVGKKGGFGADATAVGKKGGFAAGAPAVGKKTGAAGGRHGAAGQGRGARRWPGADFWLPFAAALAVGLALAAYNVVRFGDPLEFGHRYLPEFQQAEYGQFSVHYFWGNLCQQFSPVTLTAGLDLRFSLFNGFLFFVANPIFLLCGIQLVRRAARGALTRRDAVLGAGFALSLAALCLHKTMGGWQFGARYTVDLIPYALLGSLCAAHRAPAAAGAQGSPARRGGGRTLPAAPCAADGTPCTADGTPRRAAVQPWEWFLCAAAVLFNLYGAVYMLGH